MGIGKEIAGWLRGRPTLAAMLDADEKQAPRIHPRILPQSAGREPRAIVYHLISDVSESSLAGVVKASNAILQFDCYGRTPDEADRLRDTLKKQLDTIVYGAVGNYWVHGIDHDGDRDVSDEPMDASETWRFICQCDYRVMYCRPTT